MPLRTELLPCDWLIRYLCKQVVKQAYLCTCECILPSQSNMTKILCSSTKWSQMCWKQLLLQSWGVLHESTLHLSLCVHERGHTSPTANVSQDGGRSYLLQFHTTQNRATMLCLCWSYTQPTWEPFNTQHTQAVTERDKNTHGIIQPP